MKILCKLCSPAPGDLDAQLNGVPFDAVPRTQLREMLSYVAQRPFIFPGTIEDNIRVGRPDASREEVMRAALAAGVLMFERPRTAADGALETQVDEAAAAAEARERGDDVEEEVEVGIETRSDLDGSK